MESKFLKINDEKQWEGLLNKALFKTFFHELGWERFLESQFKWLKFERYNYQGKALLSLARIRGILISHPFCEYGGVLPLEDHLDGEVFKRDLFNKFKSPIKISFHPQILKYFVTEPEAFLGPSGRNTYVIKDFDHKTQDETWASFRKTLKHSIKKAQNQNLEIGKCRKEELDVFYNLYIKSAKKHSVPAYPFSFFEYFLDFPNSEIILAKHNGKIIAGSVFLFYPVKSDAVGARSVKLPSAKFNRAEQFNGVNDKFIHYFQNAVDEKYKNSGANYLILWQQIQNHLGKNYQIFDFGGTRKNSPLEVFKRGWGGKEYPVFELTNYAKSGFRNSKMRNLFGFLPPFLIKKLSPYLLRYKL